MPPARARVSRAEMPPADGRCPGWLARYAAWHRQHRHDGNYLVYTCRPTNGHCLGFGDRFRLIAFMLRAAATFDRVLLIDWESPAPLDGYFVPATFDWRLSRAEKRAFAEMRVERWLGGLPNGLPNPRPRVIRAVGNTPFFMPIGAGHSNQTARADIAPASYACLWRALFRPSRRRVACTRANHNGAAL